MAQYLPIFVMLVLALVFGALSRVASQLLGAPQPDRRPSRRPTSAASSRASEPPERFPVQASSWWR